VSPRVSGNLVTVMSMVLWATAFPVTELLLEGWHPLLMVPPRLAFATLGLGLLMLFLGGAGRLRGVPWRDVALLGGLGLGAGTTLLVWGQAYSNPVSVAIIATTMPLVSAVVGLIGGRERVTPAIGLGIACAIAGGILASWPPEGGSPDFRGGEILVLGSVLLFVWYSRASVDRLAELSDLTKAALTMGAALVVVTIATAAAVSGGLVEARYEASLASLGLLLWLGCVSNGPSMVLWLFGARQLGVTIASIHLNAVPFYVILIALAAGGSLYPTQVWGACLVALGALLAQLPGLRRARV
jgi:drug/metabolite transporter (DMT)-like permease